MASDSDMSWPDQYVGSSDDRSGLEFFDQLSYVKTHIEECHGCLKLKKAYQILLDHVKALSHKQANIERLLSRLSPRCKVPEKHTANAPVLSGQSQSNKPTTLLPKSQNGFRFPALQSHFQDNIYSSGKPHNLSTPSPTTHIHFTQDVNTPSQPPSTSPSSGGRSITTSHLYTISPHTQGMAQTGLAEMLNLSPRPTSILTCSNNSAPPQIPVSPPPDGLVSTPRDFSFFSDSYDQLISESFTGNAYPTSPISIGANNTSLADPHLLNHSTAAAALPSISKLLRGRVTTGAISAPTSAPSPPSIALAQTCSIDAEKTGFTAAEPPFLLSDPSAADITKIAKNMRRPKLPALLDTSGSGFSCFRLAPNASLSNFVGKKRSRDADSEEGHDTFPKKRRRKRTSRGDASAAHIP